MDSQKLASKLSDVIAFTQSESSFRQQRVFCDEICAARGSMINDKYDKTPLAIDIQSYFRMVSENIKKMNR